MRFLFRRHQYLLNSISQNNPVLCQWTHSKMHLIKWNDCYCHGFLSFWKQNSALFPNDWQIFLFGIITMIIPAWSHASESGTFFTVSFRLLPVFRIWCFDFHLWKKNPLMLWAFLKPFFLSLFFRKLVVVDLISSLDQFTSILTILYCNIYIYIK